MKERRRNVAVSYAGIDATSRWPSSLGFNPNGEETIAFSSSFTVWRNKSEEKGNSNLVQGCCCNEQKEKE